MAGRTDLLRDILYNADFYEWCAVKRFYAAVLSEIEMGIRQWENGTLKLEQQILMPFPFKKQDVKKGKQ